MAAGGPGSASSSSRDGPGGDDDPNEGRENYKDWMDRMRKKGYFPPKASAGLAWIVHAPAPTTDACDLFPPTCFHF